MSKITVAAGTLLAALSIAPTALASVYDVPAQTVERRVWTIDITGVPPRAERHEVAELLVDQDRFRLERRDARTGRIVEIVHSSAEGHVIRDYEDRLFVAAEGARPLPGPGYAADRMRRYLARGTFEPLAREVVAGLKARTYVMAGGRERDDFRLEVAVEAGTLQPLRRTSTADNGAFGRFRQEERLVSSGQLTNEGAGERLARAERWARERAELQGR